PSTYEERRPPTQRGRAAQLHVEQKTGKYASNAQRNDRPDADSGESQNHAVAEYELDNLARKSSDRNSDTNLPCSLDHSLADHGIQAQRSERHRQKAQ